MMTAARQVRTKRTETVEVTATVTSMPSEVEDELLGAGFSEWYYYLQQTQEIDLSLC